MNRILVALCRAFTGCSVWWRQNAGTVERANGARVDLGPAGIADIMGCLNGRAVAVEVKRPGEKQRKSQKLFQAAWEKAGGIYIVATSPEAAVSSLKALQEAWNA